MQTSISTSLEIGDWRVSVLPNLGCAVEFALGVSPMYFHFCQCSLVCVGNFDLRLQFDS